jgi:hypothetical protein
VSTSVTPAGALALCRTSKPVTRSIAAIFATPAPAALHATLGIGDHRDRGAGHRDGEQEAERRRKAASRSGAIQPSASAAIPASISLTTWNVPRSITRIPSRPLSPGAEIPNAARCPSDETPQYERTDRKPAQHG